jgi:SAM-dependent methyltransferase
MDTSARFEQFDSVYKTGSAPWLIGQPQPAIVDLEHDGWIRGSVLDPGCGAGEHTIHLARLGYDVVGIDFSPHAVEQARETAAARRVAARFEVANALDLGDAPRFDTIVDSALFHIFAAEERAAYVRSLHAVCRPGGLLHVLALSDAGPRVGPQVGETAIRDAFGAGWVLEDLAPSHYRIVVDAEKGALLGAGPGELADAAAWLARIRRI